MTPSKKEDKSKNDITSTPLTEKKRSRACAKRYDSISSGVIIDGFGSASPAGTAKGSSAKGTCWTESVERGAGVSDSGRACPVRCLQFDKVMRHGHEGWPSCPMACVLFNLTAISRTCAAPFSGPSRLNASWKENRFSEHKGIVKKQKGRVSASFNRYPAGSEGILSNGKKGAEASRMAAEDCRHTGYANGLPLPILKSSSLRCDASVSDSLRSGQGSLGRRAGTPGK